MSSVCVFINTTDDDDAMEDVYSEMYVGKKCFFVFLRTTPNN